MNKTQLSRLLWAIKISLVVTIVYVAATVLVVPLRLGETFKPKEASGRESARPTDNTIPGPRAAPDYSVVASSGLFGDSEQTPTPPTLPASMQTARPQATEDEMGLKLVGAIAGGADSSRAIIEDCKTKITNPYKIGDTVASATIESIERDKIVVRYGGRNRTLLLRTDTTLASVKPADANGVRPPSGAAAAPAMAVTPSPSADRLGQVETLLRKATIEPYVEKGQAEGLKITGLENIPTAATFGLKNGDIIQSVNGQVLTGKQKAFQVLQKAKAQPKVNMRLLRDGKVTDLSFNVH